MYEVVVQYVLIRECVGTYVCSSGSNTNEGWAASSAIKFDLSQARSQTEQPTCLSIEVHVARQSKWLRILPSNALSTYCRPECLSGVFSYLYNSTGSDPSFTVCPVCETPHRGLGKSGSRASKSSQIRQLITTPNLSWSQPCGYRCHHAEPNGSRTSKGRPGK